MFHPRNRRRAPVDLSNLIPFSPFTGAILVAGAVVAGFVTGLAGFGTALVALAFWLGAWG